MLRMCHSDQPSIASERVGALHRVSTASARAQNAKPYVAIAPPRVGAIPTGGGDSLLPCALLPSTISTPPAITAAPPTPPSRYAFVWSLLPLDSMSFCACIHSPR